MQEQQVTQDTAVVWSLAPKAQGPLSSHPLDTARKVTVPATPRQAGAGTHIELCTPEAGAWPDGPESLPSTC